MIMDIDTWNLLSIGRRTTTCMRFLATHLKDRRGTPTCQSSRELLLQLSCHSSLTYLSLSKNFITITSRLLPRATDRMSFLFLISKFISVKSMEIQSTQTFYVQYFDQQYLISTYTIPHNSSDINYRSSHRVADRLECLTKFSYLRLW